MCLYPKLIKNPKYIKNNKNGGNIPPLPFVKIKGKTYKDERVLQVPVGCGKCIECCKKKSREWQVRLAEEIRSNKNGIFVTLTFSNESIQELYNEKMILHKLEGYERDNEIATIAVRRFLERWRKEHKKSVKHWLVTELGHEGTENIHLHGIIWTDIPRQNIDKHWKYGYTWIGDKKNSWVNNQTINYITKYMTKIDLDHREYKPKILCSKGIGRNYIDSYNALTNKYNKTNTNEAYKTTNGSKLALPIYYRNHIYNEQEREELWRQKLDKNERWVMGEKIDVSQGDEEYYKLLEYYRKKNKRLGYGDDIKNWERRLYENERRNINFIKRLKKK